jgi:hypothetical protein
VRSRPAGISDPLPEQELLSWVERLTSLEAERCTVARERIGELGLQAVSRELLEGSLDAAVGAVLLVEGLDRLVAAGVPESKLLSKLRRDPDLWPTWAEIRAAALLLDVAADAIELEVDRAAGRHADFILHSEGADPAAVEFKALGLADHEVEFAKRAQPVLEQIVPRRGIATLHARLETTALSIPRGDRRAMERNAAKIARRLPGATREISGTVVVGHGTEDIYATRLRRRFEEALAQLAADRPSWLAFWWSNGAPVEALARALVDVDVPEHVVGLILLGTLLPLPDPMLHNFVVFRDAPFDAEPEKTIRSTADDHVATTLFEAIEATAGVRTAVVRVPGADGEWHEILRRDGGRRILPFNLVFGRDPEQLERPTL